jgi:hypothetical protein
MKQRVKHFGVVSHIIRLSQNIAKAVPMITIILTRRKGVGISIARG